VSGRAFNSHEAMIVSDGSNTPSDFLKSLSAQSLLAVPIGDGLEKVGVISLVSTEENFFSKRDVGRIQLLGALVAYVHARSKNPKSNTEAAAKLGRAFSAIRGELGLTQDEQSAILHRPPYLIARWPKNDSPVNSRKLSIYWVSVNVRGEPTVRPCHRPERSPLRIRIRWNGNIL
jgi:hypothetical protein